MYSLSIALASDALARCHAHALARLATLQRHLYKPFSIQADLLVEASELLLVHDSPIAHTERRKNANHLKEHKKKDS
jgi:hypothetical protein